MPQRIQLSRQKGWRKPDGAVVVSRPSRWGNPFSVERWGRERAVEWFEMLANGYWSPSKMDDLSESDYYDVYTARLKWMDRLRGHPSEIARAELAGFDLACWCRPDELCHADVLLEVANR